MFPCQVRGAARSAAARRLYHDVLGASGPRARLAPARARAGEGGEPMGHCAAHARGRVRRSHCHSGAAGITPTRHAISSTFADKARYVVDTYFSRDPMRWPLFADPTVAALNNVSASAAHSVDLNTPLACRVCCAAYIAASTGTPHHRH